jgi:hypothetical protein
VVDLVLTTDENTQLQNLKRFPLNDKIPVFFLFITSLGLGILAFQDTSARRLIFFILSVGISYYIAVRFFPLFYFPQRYVLYSVPILLSISFPVATAVIVELTINRRRQKSLRPVTIAAVTVLCLILFGGRGSQDSGFTVKIDKELKIYDFLETLPKDALIAGWPTGIINNVPYMSKRKAFLTQEMHQVIYKDYAETMRKRMYALINAYFARSVESLIELRDTYGVSHLIVNRQHFFKNPPEYFKPFNYKIHERYKEGEKEGFELIKYLDSARVYSERDYIVIEMEKMFNMTRSNRPADLGNDIK